MAKRVFYRLLFVKKRFWGTTGCTFCRRVLITFDLCVVSCLHGVQRRHFTPGLFLFLACHGVSFKKIFMHVPFNIVNVQRVMLSRVFFLHLLGKLPLFYLNLLHGLLLQYSSNIVPPCLPMLDQSLSVAQLHNVLHRSCLFTVIDDLYLRFIDS